MTCRDCESNASYTVRVTIGSFTGAHESEYACPLCVDATFNRMTTLFAQPEVVPLPVRVR